MYTDNLAGMIGREVEVEAEGIFYRGRLIEVTDSEVFIQGPLGWIQLPVQTVKAIRLNGPGAHETP